jgi:hypothetical protein
MATGTSGAEEFQGQFLDAVRKSQEAVIDGLRSWTETVQQFLPQQPQRGSWPQAQGLPTTAELVDSVFDFAAQLLNAQREFAHGILAATAPIADRARQGTEEAAQQAQNATTTGKRGS